jgi:hypothetical protein
MTSDPLTPRVYRVLVTGSRTWTDTTAITQALDDLHARHGHALTVVHGACPRGADAIADTWAARHQVPVQTFPADWSTGRAAGPARNAVMVATGPDECLAFIDDGSRGASDTAVRAEAAGIPTRRHTPRPTRGTTDAPAGQLIEQDDDQLVAVVDGPLAGQWFTWADWQHRLRAARYMADRTERRSPVLDYLPGGYQITHPFLAHTHGQAAVHRPATSSGTSPASSSAGSGGLAGNTTAASLTPAQAVRDVSGRIQATTEPVASVVPPVVEIVAGPSGAVLGADDVADFTDDVADFGDDVADFGDDVEVDAFDLAR